jgi:hypothetical protein
MLGVWVATAERVQATAPDEPGSTDISLQYAQVFSHAAQAISGVVPLNTPALTVEIVEDRAEDHIRTAVVSALLERGVGVQSANTASEALELRVTLDRIDVAVTDTRRKALFGSREVLRRVDVTLGFELSEDNAILVGNTASAYSEVWIPEHALRAKANEAELSVPVDIAVRVAEMVVVGGAVTTVLFLFFTK